jgi:hypothetical protein
MSLNTAIYLMAGIAIAISLTAQLKTKFFRAAL